MVYHSESNGCRLKFFFFDDGKVAVDFNGPGSVHLTPEEARDLGVLLDVHARNAMIKEG